MVRDDVKPLRTLLTSHMQRDSKTDAAEPYEVCPSDSACGSATAKTPTGTRTHLLFLAKASTECAIKIDEAVFAIPSHVWFVRAADHVFLPTQPVI